MRTIWLGLTVGLVLVAAHACSNDFTKFNFDGVPSGGAAGAGLTGGGGSGGGGTGGTGGAPSECNGPSDCPGQNTTCRVRSCSGHQCGFANTIKGAECSEGGGEICNGHGLCVAATCSDGVRTGNETGVDCGGPCPPCALGEECLSDGDCQSRFCDKGTAGSGGGAGTGGSGGAAGTGGSAGAAGTAGSGGGPLVWGHCTACGNDSDCADLPDAYCDGTSCLDRKAGGAACTTAHECSSGQCPAQDLVCCDAACDAACEACLAAKTGAADGTCAAVTAATDPDTECADQGPDSCGASGAGCNGDGVAPACTLYDDTTVCAVHVCTGDPPQEIATGLCSGAGVCEPGAPSSCAPYRCNGGASACLTGCTANGDADCYGATYCDTPTHHCLSKLADGLDCAGPTECQSGFCADGKCCLTDCTASCMACSAAKKGGGANGTCGFVAAGTNPDSDCTATQACDGNGGCKLADGEICAVGADCAAGFCPAQDLVCCNAPCSGTCEACTAAKKGSGQDGACGYVLINTDPDGECAGPQNCNGSGVCI